MAGIDGIIRDSARESQHIYNRALGEGMNNEMEFASMEQVPQILKNAQVNATVIEEDSELSITASRKLYVGAKESKVTKHWRVAKVIENIVGFLREMKGLIF